MTTLYLDRKKSELRVTRHHLEIRLPTERVQRIPLKMLERVVIAHNQTTDTRSLARLALSGIAVHIINGRRELALASVFGQPGPNVRRRLAQYALWNDPEKSRELTQRLVHLKLRAQSQMVNRLLSHRPDKRKKLKDTITTLCRLHFRLLIEKPTRAQIRGVEGAAAAAVFRALVAVMPPELGFTGRQRRPPPDPVNAILSLGYTLGYGMALEAIHATGLDPYLGYLHEPQHGRYSLASDLMEPLRPRIEWFAWELFRKRTLNAEHFTKNQDGCRLNKDGRSIFYRKWEKQAPVWRRALRMWAYHLIHWLESHAHDNKKHANRI